jgi:ACS family hexuronate transporter-like MFS transporter
MLLKRHWWICGLLLLATMVNYMDRQTLSLSKVALTTDLGLNNAQYGHLETGFGLAFAFGSLVFGFAAERWSVRWLYPAILAVWSLAAAACAWTHNFEQLLVCRIVFGIFEAGHWPCAVKVTFATLEPRDRTLGNSILQSGASVASIITPQVLKVLMSASDPSSWRYAFQVVGLAGLAWVVLWFAVVRPSDLGRSSETQTTTNASVWPVLITRKFWAVAILIVGAQTCWQLFRVWLPSFLEQGRGYSHDDALNFSSAYYISTDIGCLGAGALSLWLVKRWPITPHRARRIVYGLCSALACASVLVPWLPRGPLLLGVILLVGASALGLFPCYYSFVQDLSSKHVAQLTGILSMWVWAVTSPMHSLFGAMVDRTKSFDLGMALAGLAPLLGVASLALLWPPRDSPTDNNATSA